MKEFFNLLFLRVNKNSTKIKKEKSENNIIRISALVKT